MQRVIFDFSKLRGRIIEQYGSCAAFSAAAGFKHGALSMRLNNQTPWKGHEIHTACEMLGISAEEVSLYFFTQKFRKVEQ